MSEMSVTNGSKGIRMLLRARVLSFESVGTQWTFLIARVI